MSRLIFHRWMPIAIVLLVGSAVGQAVGPASAPAAMMPADVVNPNALQRLNLYVAKLDKPRFEWKDRDWPAKPGEASVCLWKDDAYAAASTGIDDNEAYNLPWWMPELKKFDLKPTWWLVTATIKDGPAGSGQNGGTWEDWKKVIAAGYEVGSHTVDHLNSGVPTWDNMDIQYGDSKKAIEAHLGVRCLTMSYPGGVGMEKNDASVAAKYYIAARGRGYANTAGKIDYLQIRDESGFVVRANKKVFWDDGSLEDVVDHEGRQRRGWWVGFLHWIHGDNAKEIAELEERFAYIADKVKSGELWLGFFSEVARYGQERDTATLTVKSVAVDKIVLDLRDEMNDLLFDFPLTVKVRIDDTCASITATQNNKPVGCKIIEHEKAKFALVQAVPDRGLVVLLPRRM